MSAHDEAVEKACDGFLDAQRDGRDRIRATIRAYLAHMAAAGWKLTPKEATAGMCEAGHRIEPVADVWSAMHDAAPSPEEAS